MGLGIGIGATYAGYREGREDMLSDKEWEEKRLDREERRGDRATRRGIDVEDREREIKRRLWADPQAKETAGINIQGARRTDELEEHTRQYKKDAADRNDRMGVQKEDDSNWEREFNRREILRKDAAGGRTEKSELNWSEVDQNNMGDYRSNRTAQEAKRNGDNAIAHFERTADPKFLEDYYNNMFDDDGQISIVKNEDGTYTGTYGDGRVVENQTKEDIIEGSRAFFATDPARQGASGRQQGMGSGIGSTNPYETGLGRKGAGKESAFAEEIRIREGVHRDAGKSPSDARALAVQEAGQAAGKSPQQVRTDTVMDLVKMWSANQRPALPMVDENGDETETQEEAQIRVYMELFKRAESFADRLSGATPAGIPTEKVDVSSIPQGAIKYFLSRPDTPEERKHFDAEYFQGAAEAVRKQ